MRPQEQDAQARAERDPGRDLLNEIRAELPPKVAPEAAVRAVMCTFSRHIAGVDVREVFQALPESLHGLLDRCMLHRPEEPEQFGSDQLIVRVAEHLEVPLEDSERITFAVLTKIRRRLPGHAVKAVEDQLPLELRELWLEPQRRL